MRPKIKESVSVSIRMDKTVFDMLETFCDDAGQSKTLAIERAVKAYVEAYNKKQASELKSDNLIEGCNGK